MIFVQMHALVSCTVRLFTHVYLQAHLNVLDQRWHTASADCSDFERSHICKGLGITETFHVTLACFRPGLGRLAHSADCVILRALTFKALVYFLIFHTSGIINKTRFSEAIWALGCSPHQFLGQLLTLEPTLLRPLALKQSTVQTIKGKILHLCTLMATGCSCSQTKVLKI